MSLSELLGREADRIDPCIARLLERALQDEDVEPLEALPLACTTGRELRALVKVADVLRERQCGAVVTYVINRNVNFTNVCIKRCSFCAFSRDYRQEEGYYLPQEEILRRIAEAVSLGATEVCIQAGLPPKMEGTLYVELTRTIRRQFPDLHIHAFSPEEVLYGSIRARVTVREYLEWLQEAGLDSLPGTSAEILDQELRDRIAPGRIRVDQWLEVITNAHDLGIRTTSTMMYGHVEEPRHWVEHLALLRSVQKETGGFTEFVPLSFVHQEAPMTKQDLVPGARPGATGNEVLRMHALARVMLGSHLRNIQASWVKEGPKLAQVLLDAGVNDLGGTLINESISTSAGASFGQLVPPVELRRLIRDAGRVPAQRNTGYGILRTFGEEEERTPLDEIADPEERFGSFHRLVVSDAHRYVHPSRRA
ncbi:MAG: 5-amino-6-(D-ribitylamino)uracil--L-tyrosine 4-hydroxyphenyl transferase CofH [Armatimonadetes bacterium]|nr:5-amino-6-(D-ribitylamino)uracil--L-tyrosine 4-hydroxyphenyl transferase CofH [Armatimonadota bacterium]